MLCVQLHAVESDNTPKEISDADLTLIVNSLADGGDVDEIDLIKRWAVETYPQLLKDQNLMALAKPNFKNVDVVAISAKIENWSSGNKIKPGLILLFFSKSVDKRDPLAALLIVKGFAIDLSKY